jgi:hypothetical protein
MRRFAVVSVLLTAVMLVGVGCATIVAGTTQSMSITSNVDGAEIYLDGEKIGTTPFNGPVKKNGKELRLELRGHRTSTVVLSKTLEGVFWGNIIFGGTLGSITDFASGAAYAYAPATYQVDLKADGVSMDQFNRQVSARKFAMLFIDEISRDLAAGSGDHLSALSGLIAPENSAAGLDVVRSALRNSGGDQVLFGRAMVASL